MGLVNKFFTGVSGIYNSVNPLTFSGVNDVIVVHTSANEFKCSPFQLRFSKLQFFRSHTVHLYVNGQLSDINMTLTSEGDLCFENNFLANANKTTERSGPQILNIIGNEDDEIIEQILQNNIFAEKATEENYEANSSQADKNMTKTEDPDLNTENHGDSIYNSLLHNTYAGNIHSTITNSCSISTISATNSLYDVRLYNLKKRLFKLRPYSAYAALAKIHDKFVYLLESTEHYEYLISRSNDLLKVFELLIFDNPKATVSFSKCMNIKIEQVGIFMNENIFDQMFDDYLTKEIEDVENIVVKLTYIKYKTSKEMDTFISSNDFVYFYLSFSTFTKIFFQLKQSSKKYHTLIKILEQLHNKCLGWNIFGTKKALKKEVGFSLILNSEELKSLNLKNGKNEVIFKINGMDKKLTGNLYLWEITDKIIISDIDGTITKSDLWGQISGFIGTDWSHTGVASLYSRIVKNGYKIIYLSSRPLGQSSSTKAYLRNVIQDNSTLPDGPVLLNPDSLMGALYREVIAKNPEEFKISCLKKIQQLFSEENEAILLKSRESKNNKLIPGEDLLENKGDCYKEYSSPSISECSISSSSAFNDSLSFSNCFVAGFGNKITDVVTYKAINIPKNRIYTINPKGQLQAEYSQSLVGTYHTINEFIDTIFPPLKSQNNQENSKYNDFQWWWS